MFISFLCRLRRWNLLLWSSSLIFPFPLMRVILSRWWTSKDSTIAYFLKYPKNGGFHLCSQASSRSSPRMISINKNRTHCHQSPRHRLGFHPQAYLLHHPGIVLRLSKKSKPLFFSILMDKINRPFMGSGSHLI